MNFNNNSRFFIDSVDIVDSIYSVLDIVVSIGWILDIVISIDWVVDIVNY